jgi:hypothetical protein
VSDGLRGAVRFRVRLSSVLLFVLVNLSCGSFRDISQAISNEICRCGALEPDTTDYRHVAKHVPIPSGTPQETGVATILTWPQDPIPLPIDQPRTGRELQLVHVAVAFLQRNWATTIDGASDLKASFCRDRRESFKDKRWTELHP